MIPTSHLSSRRAKKHILETYPPDDKPLSYNHLQALLDLSKELKVGVEEEVIVELDKAVCSTCETDVLWKYWSLSEQLKLVTEQISQVVQIALAKVQDSCNSCSSTCPAIPSEITPYQRYRDEVLYQGGLLPLLPLPMPTPLSNAPSSSHYPDDLRSVATNDLLPGGQSPQSQYSQGDTIDEPLSQLSESLPIPLTKTGNSLVDEIVEGCQRQKGWYKDPNSQNFFEGIPIHIPSEEWDAWRCFGEGTDNVGQCSFTVLKTKIKHPKKAIERHVFDQHLGRKCPRCKKVCKTNEFLETHFCEKKEKQGTKTCRKCWKVFDNQSLLSTHSCPMKMKDVKGIPTTSKQCDFVCSICDKPLSSQRTLDTHLINVHQLKTEEEIKTHMCHICSKSYAKDGLTKHLRDVHDVGTPLQKFKCPEDGCTKEFPTQFRLKRHLSSSTHKEEQEQEDVKNVLCNEVEMAEN